MVEQNVKCADEVVDCDRIKGLGLSSLVYPIIRASLLGMGTNIMFSLSKVDAYISVLIGIIIGIVPLSLTLYIIKNSKGEDIIDINIRVFGKVFGNILNIALNIFTILFASLIFYNLTLFLDIQYIPDTNPLYIKILVMIPIVYAASKNIATITRISQIILVIGIVMFLISGISVSFEFDTENLLPVLENGIIPPIKAGIIYAIFSCLPLLYMTIVPTKFEESSKNRNKKIIGMYFLSNLIVFTIFFTMIGTLGYETISIYKYPECSVLKNISILSVIERIEDTLSLQFLFTMSLFIIILCYFIIRSSKKVLKKLKSQELIPYVIGIIVICIAYNMFPNSSYASYFIQKYVPYITAIVLLGSLLLTSIGIFIYNRLNRNQLDKT